MFTSQLRAMSLPLFLLATRAPRAALAQSLDTDSREDIIESAGVLAEDLIAYHNASGPGGIPGVVTGEGYGWWHGAVMMGSYVDYWQLTGDDEYNEVVREGVLHQAGEDNDFQPRNWTASMGNEDQCLWALAAMSAAEYGFPNPPSGEAQWIELAQNAFETQAWRSRQETGETCGAGGLRWGITPASNTWGWKSAFTNGCFMNLAARLARYTGNETYATYATTAWDWLYDVELIDHDNHTVYEGIMIDEDEEGGCEKDGFQAIAYMSAPAIIIEAAAFMYNYTEDEEWADRINDLSEPMIKTFFPDDIAREIFCEDEGFCFEFIHSQKALAMSSLAVTTQVAPFTADTFLPLIRASGEAAAQSCRGGQCEFGWSGDSTSSSTDAATLMSAFSAVSNLLIEGAASPATDATSGGDSGDNGDNDNGNSNNGNNGDSNNGGNNGGNNGDDSNNNGDSNNNNNNNNNNNSGDDSNSSGDGDNDDSAASKPLAGSIAVVFAAMGIFGLLI